MSRFDSSTTLTSLERRPALPGILDLVPEVSVEEAVMALVEWQRPEDMETVPVQPPTLAQLRTAYDTAVMMVRSDPAANVP